MKHPLPSMRGLAGKAMVLLALCVAMTAFGQDAPQLARVIRVHGSARYSTDNKTWQTIGSGDFLPPGCVIQTADKSGVDLQLGTPEAGAKGTIDDKLLHGRREATADLVRMFESCVLAIDTLSSEQSGAVKKIELDLRAGGIMGSVTKKSGDSTYEVRLPTGVAGTPGGTYLLRSSGKARVLTGRLIVVVAAGDGSMSTKVIRAGQDYNPATGQITAVSEGNESPISETPAAPAVASTPAQPSPQPSAFPQPQYQYPKRSF